VFNNRGEMMLIFLHLSRAESKVAFIER